MSHARLRLVLASASPRRAELLSAAGFAFDLGPVDVDERILADESPFDYVRRLAGDKAARAVARLPRAVLPQCVVLGADTAVVVDGHVLGKPASDEEAAAMLRQLSGRRHEVLTGVHLQHGGRAVGSVTETAVFFSPLGDEEVAWLVQSGEGRDKAGAYAVQGRAARFIPRIEGSYSNVVGLPIAAVTELMSRLGLAPTDLASGS